MKYKFSEIKKTQPIGLSCKKASYNTLAEAEDMIKYIRETRVTREVRAYKCTICGSWHLTSKT